MSKFIGNTNDYIAWEEKRQRRVAKKQALIEKVIEDLKDNQYDSQEYIFALCHEVLQTRTNKELYELIGN
jgi:hypothetical protein